MKGKYVVIIFSQSWPLLSAVFKLFVKLVLLSYNLHNIKLTRFSAQSDTFGQMYTVTITEYVVSVTPKVPSHPRVLSPLLHPQLQVTTGFPARVLS